jgi:hypothetical protein
MYPIQVLKVEYIDFISKKLPDGCIQISCSSIDGHYSTGLLRCYTSKKGKYAVWGKRRFYVGYNGPVKLIGVPYGIIETVKKFCIIDE